MGFWSWLLRILAEPPSEERGSRGRHDRSIPGGLERFEPPSMREPFKKFRTSFGNQGDNEE